MSVGTLLYTWMNGRQVGTDSFGNRYYEHKSRTRRDGRHPRWVLYKGMVEASKVPAEWHGWLHYSVNDVPSVDDPQRFEWQKDHLPNLTGTRYAYRPPGHILRGGKRDHATGDYEPWTPA
jgi:NADH:ubiquinone oxidoreductase subunit